MPVYPGAANSVATNSVPPLPVAIYPGDTVAVFAAEQPAVPSASVAVAIAQAGYDGIIPNLAVEGFLSGAVGAAFSLQLQTSDTDADGMYQNEGAAITQANVSANNTFRGEFANVRAKFARLLLTARTNAVNLTARISR
jgi:hypothetical protein